MFGKKQRTQKEQKPPKVTDIGNVPPTAYDRAKAEWAERNGNATVNQARLFVIAVGLLLGLIILGFALTQMLPLKTAVPYQITFDQGSGKTEARPIKVENFSPTEVQRRYFLAKWVRDLLTIDPYTIERSLADAFRISRGKAIDEFRTYVKDTQVITRVQQDRSLIRTVDLSSLQFIGEGVAQARIVMRERTQASVGDPKRYILTLHYGIEPPTTESEMLSNPVGLFITHFAIAEELQ